MGPSFEIRQQQFTLQAHFASPVVRLFREFPELAHHLFQALGNHGLRLENVRLDSAGESLGEVNLQMSWPDLATARLFLERLDLAAAYRFLGYQNGSLLPDLLSAVSDYSPEVSYRAFAVTQELHGALTVPLKDFLSRFSTGAPASLGPAMGSGAIYYFGASDNRFASSLALDLSRLVEEGLFLRLVTIYDASQVNTSDLMAVSRLQLSNLVHELGLELAGN